jgi:hypothetical protein
MNCCCRLPASADAASDRHTLDLQWTSSLLFFRSGAGHPPGAFKLLLLPPAAAHLVSSLQVPSKSATLNTLGYPNVCFLQVCLLLDPQPKGPPVPGSVHCQTGWPGCRKNQLGWALLKLRETWSPGGKIHSQTPCRTPFSAHASLLLCQFASYNRDGSTCNLQQMAAHMQLSNTVEHPC